MRSNRWTAYKVTTVTNPGASPESAWQLGRNSTVARFAECREFATMRSAMTTTPSCLVSPPVFQHEEDTTARLGGRQRKTLQDGSEKVKEMEPGKMPGSFFALGADWGWVVRADTNSLSAPRVPPSWTDHSAT